MTLLLSELEWRAEANCSGFDPDLWFAPGALEHKEAKRICRSCPVRRECLSYALETPVDHGVWGGMTERERRSFRRRQEAATLSASA
jgi:WhiB family redox-sensing transcriptional regulator